MVSKVRMTLIALPIDPPQPQRAPETSPARSRNADASERSVRDARSFADVHDDQREPAPRGDASDAVEPPDDQSSQTPSLGAASNADAAETRVGERRAPSAEAIVLGDAAAVANASNASAETVGDARQSFEPGATPLATAAQSVAASPLDVKTPAADGLAAVTTKTNIANNVVGSSLNAGVGAAAAEGAGAASLGIARTSTTQSSVSPSANAAAASEALSDETPQAETADSGEKPKTTPLRIAGDGRPFSNGIVRPTAFPVASAPVAVEPAAPTADLATAQPDAANVDPAAEALPIDAGGRVETASGAAQSRAVGGGVAAAGAPVVRQQIVSAIVGRGGESRIEVALNPPELGRILIDFDVRADGAVTAVVSADLQDTHDTLRRNLDLLRRELADSGLETMDLSMGERGRDEASERAAAEPGFVEPQEAPTPSAPAPKAYAIDPAGRLDIRI